MSALRLSALLVYTFGALTYGALLVLWVRELGRVGWAGRVARQVELINGALTVVGFLWFGGLIWQILMALGNQVAYWPLEFGLVAVAYAFPPLIMHITWAEVTSQHPRPASRAWVAVLRSAYIAAAGIPLVTIWLMASASAGWYRPALRALGAGLPLLFIATAVFCIVLISRQPRAVRSREGRAKWAMAGLFGLMLLLFVAILAVSELQGGMYPTGYAFVGSGIEVMAKSLPLVFVFVSTYYESRFHFFDLFVKRGFSLLVTLGVLTIWFSVTLPLLAPLTSSSAAPWLFAVTLLPVVALTPWLYARIGRVLDRRWLGRRYATVEAVTRFLAGLRSATSEAEAVARAEECLTDIFRAPATVQAGETATPPAFAVRHETPVGPAHGTAGRFLLGPRAGDAPYFSQDVALLRSLADVFASVLDNLRLQDERRAEEQRVQDLSLSASRSELKALRAQINPHFLFNALNSIAGLIDRDPATADRTIEKLADIFRYTLRSSESEWALLEDEIEFVRAYLVVEQARFGDRLEVVINVDDSVEGTRLPTMIIHTLVENAVKHGVAAVRGPARIEIHARAGSGELRVSVSDNGPGFGTAGPPEGRHRGGYGLANVRQRLEGYFGRDAVLQIARHADRATTVVTVSMPLVAEPPLAAGGAR